MSVPKQTPVLVVGAGPNGLVTAITLTHLGHKVTLVDALPVRKVGARGALVHARTLEMIKTVDAGLASNLANSEWGIQSTGVAFHGDTNMLLDANVANLASETDFPYVLLLSQEHTERIMTEHLKSLGVEAITNTRVVGMTEDPNGNGVLVTFDDGSVCATPYVIGADGARSVIRTLSGVDFKDPFTNHPYDEDVDSSEFVQITLADIYVQEGMTEAIPRDSVSWHMNGRVMFCPIVPPAQIADPKKGTYWRIGLVIPPGSKSPPPRPLTVEWLQQEITARKPWPEDITVTQLYTGASYRVRSAVADTFFKRMFGGIICLVGDAAHVHSPTGGQGMNLGICDAVSLARAIDKHMHQDESKDPSDEILQQFSTSRRRNAITVIGATHNLTRILNAPDGWPAMGRNILMRVAGWFPFIQRKAAWRLSGLEYRGQ